MGERVTKKVRQGPVDIDYDESALVVNYEVEKVSVDSSGRVLDVLSRKSEVRRVKLKSLSMDKNMAQLAADIVDKCSYIHPSRTEEVEQLLIKLRKFQYQKDKDQESARLQRRDDERAGGRDSEVRMSRDRESEASGRDRKRRKAERDAEEQLPPARIDDIDDYLDMLYQVGGKSDAAKTDSLRVQVRGTAMILQLCRDVMNLEVLIQNSTVMGALTRVLTEEFKKSTELTFNILRIFLSFSNFMEMHGLLANYRVGMLTMKVVEYEVKRWEHRTGDSEAARERRIQTKKQEKMLFCAFYLLLNLAEDVVVERKMLNKGLLEYLESMLERSHGDLLILVVTFFKKLSIYSENKDIIAKSGMIRKLGRFIPCSSIPLVQMTLQVLFNLSFDFVLRKQMMETKLVPKLTTLLKTAAFRGKTLKLLYHLSVDDQCKGVIGNEDGIPMIMGLVVNFPNPILARELGALANNLSHDYRNAERMVSNRGLNHLMDRLDNDYQERDQGLLKIIRNISYWTFVMQQSTLKIEDYKYRGIWAPHFRLLLELLTDTDDHDTLVELLGILANMTTLDVPANSSWSKLCREYNLLSLFSKMLIPGMAQNDLILEIVMLIAAIANDNNACDMIASSNLIGLLYQTWKEKSEDIEIKLQLIHCFHKLFMRETSREEAMYSTRIVVDIIECLTDPSAAVRAAADEVTDLVLEYDRHEDGELGQLGLQIRKKRFESYNSKWLTHFDMLSGGAGHNGSTGYGNDDGYDYQDDDDYRGVQHGSMEWKMMMRQRELKGLALDMSDLDGAGKIINDDMPSSGDEDDYDESGQDWRHH
eukprot:GSChrysophyteH1.ASY1.ANO1.1286.1 assembled CDS